MFHIKICVRYQESQSHISSLANSAYKWLEQWNTKLATRMITNSVSQNPMTSLQLPAIYRLSPWQILLPLGSDGPNGSSYWSMPELRPFHSVRLGLSVSNDLILCGRKIVIPTQPVRRQTLKLAPESHQGIVRTKQFLRGKVWCPGIDHDTQQSISPKSAPQ